MAITSTGAVQDLYSSYSAKSDTSKVSKTSETSEYGKTIGDVELSDQAKEYYNKLKEKYSDMDFVLVSSDETENAEAKAAELGDGSKMMVVIDVDRIEQMAADESVAAKYEGIIEDAAASMEEVSSQLSGADDNIAAYGIKVNDDGTTSFFAVLKKANAAQKERIENAKEEVKEEKAKEEKKAEKEETQERIEKLKSDDTETVSASSIDELLKKIQDFRLAEKSDNVMTEQETYLGQTIDFSV